MKNCKNCEGTELYPDEVCAVCGREALDEVETKNMKNEFVPYDIALAMKELGFNESCFGYYLLEDECFMDVRIRRQGEALCLAPLYQQAEGVIWYRYVIEDKEYKGFLDEQEAQEACLRKLIEIVKEKQR
jgi:hypothetical protein